MEFLFAFLPATLIVNFLLPQKARNYWLLLMSLFFYGWGEPSFLIAMIASITFNYLMALRIAELHTGSPLRKFMLAFTVVANLALLFVFKYLNFTTASLHRFFPVTEHWFEVSKFVLPIGISFFTFQALSYVVDVYRGLPVQKNPAYIGLYISLFPQLIAGPIVRYSTIEDQIGERRITLDSFSGGVLRFLRGFNKKILLANILAQVADKAFGADQLSAGMAWLGVLCYTLQIYFDFSGYSEMAIGLGHMLGFNFLENFDYPYISKTITEFWRRWHISLGTWFRDYVYFPLGGSRVDSKLRLTLNLFVVWVATGIWHGAKWNFLLWGLMYFAIIAVEKLLSLPKWLEGHKRVAILYQVFTLLVVVLGWVVFRSESLPAAKLFIKSMFGMAGNGLMDGVARFNMREYFIVFAAGCLCATPVFKVLKERISSRGPRAAVLCNGAGYAVQFLLFIVSVSFLVMNAHNPFIYFNF